MGLSFLARIVPLYFRLQPKHTEAELQKELDRRRARPEPPPRGPRGMAFRLENREKGKVFYLNEGSASGRTVFYLHGGAYWNDFSPFHWRYMKQLIHAADAEIIAPAYRLAPYGTFRDAFDLIVPLYSAYRRDHPDRKIILMGDSAGGGMALALAEHFQALGLPAPEELILFSPWVDVSMRNPELEKYASADPWLTLSLRVPGLRFGDGAPTEDYRIDPLYGDLSGIHSVLLITGTREILYPDTMKLYEKLRHDPSNELIVGQDMLHVYPLIPIPEARAATERVLRRILR